MRFCGSSILPQFPLFFSWLAHLHRAGSLSTLALFVLAAVYASVKVIEQANEQGALEERFFIYNIR